MSYDNAAVSRSLLSGVLGFSVRCIKDGSATTTPTVTTASITNITQTTATGGGNVTSQGSSAVIARGVCWNTSQNPVVSDICTSNGTGIGSFTSNMYELNPNTTYYVRAYATNNEGISYGNEVSFTTQGGGGAITVTLDNVNPNIQAYQTWTESGVVLSLQNHPEAGGNPAYFGIETDRIWLYPALLHADLSGLQGTVMSVEVDVTDWCGGGCTKAKLFDGYVEITQAGNTLTSVPETLNLSNTGGYTPDVLTVGSFEGQVLEIRIVMQAN